MQRTFHPLNQSVSRNEEDKNNFLKLQVNKKAPKTK